MSDVLAIAISSFALGFTSALYLARVLEDRAAAASRRKQSGADQ